MEQKLKAMNEFFAEQIALCQQREQALRADERTDEAVFEKIRANVYDIFRTILSVAVKTGKGDPAAVRRFFVQKIETIPAGWEAAYEAARRNDDAVKMQIEQIKLEALAQIKAQFEAVWEGAE